MVHFSDYDKTSNRQQQIVDEIDSLFTNAIKKREFDLNPSHWRVDKDAEGGIQLLRASIKNAVFNANGVELDEDTQSILVSEFNGYLKNWLESLNSHDIYTNDFKHSYSLADKSPEEITNYFLGTDVADFVAINDYGDLAIDVNDENFADKVSIDNLDQYVQEGVLEQQKHSLADEYWEPQSTFL